MKNLLSALSTASIAASSPQTALDTAKETNVMLKDLDTSLDLANSVGPKVNVGLAILCLVLAGRAVKQRSKQ